MLIKNYGFPVELIKSKRRNDNIVKPRQVVIYIIKELTDLSYQGIGNIFGIHHTSAMASYNKVDEGINSKIDMRTSLQKMIKEIKG